MTSAPPRAYGTLAFAIILGVALFYILPTAPIVFNDDFGYVRSIVGTIVRGRPFTDDWLEPWAASFSSIGALLFAVSGSMRIATYGQVAIAFATAIVAGAALLRARGLPEAKAAVWMLIGLTTPTVLFKTFELGAIPLYLACLLVAVHAAESKRWFLFAVAAVVALASRQSALLIIGLPLAMLAESWWRTRTPSLGRALCIGAGVALVAASLYAALKHGMNSTHAQRVMMPSLLSGFAWQTFVEHVLVGLAVYVVALGVGAFVLRTAVGKDEAEPTLPRVVQAFGIGVALAMWAMPLERFIAFEHGFFHDARGRLYVGLLCAASIAGWLARPRVRVAHALAALAFAGLLGLRATVWDYYFLDVAVLGLLSPMVTPGPTRVPEAPRQRARNWAPFVLFFAFHQSFVGAHKRLVDDDFAILALCERGLRAGTLSVSDLTISPFGYRGYLVYPYFIAHEGRAMHIGAFDRYFSPDATRTIIRYAHEPAPSATSGDIAIGQRIVQSGVFRFGWTKRRRYTIVLSSTPTPPAWTIDASYAREPLPMSDVAWRAHIENAEARARDAR